MYPLATQRTGSVAALVRRCLVAAAVVVLIWLATCLALFVTVDSSPARRTNAVIMLGGDSTERLPVAQSVRRATGTPNLVLSNTDTPGNASADARCAANSSARVICFRPVTKDTRGEARAIGQLIADRHWTAVTVVTSRYHATRARMLLVACTDARVDVKVSEPRLNPWQWVERFVSETGGVVETALAPPCG
ncbi:YdcF family protein [Tersicoccus solisilvae]|uniref:YdcF family protein n=1 Tax=Tersicoccus solisilvae TaxID=1882339 RepID=UPI00166BD03B|nr:ElyC/SanA/YdcF family protein [Tersicoccus solisilvae]